MTGNFDSAIEILAEAEEILSVSEEAEADEKAFAEYMRQLDNDEIEEPEWTAEDAAFWENHYYDLRLDKIVEI